MRANDKVSINAALTSRAKRQFIEILEQIFFFKRSLKHLVERVFRSKYQVQQQTGHEKEHDQQGGKDLREDAPAPGLDVAKRPGDKRKPERDQIGDTDRQEELRAARRGFNQFSQSLQNSIAGVSGP